MGSDQDEGITWRVHAVSRAVDTILGDRLRGDEETFSKSVVRPAFDAALMCSLLSDFVIQVAVDVHHEAQDGPTRLLLKALLALCRLLRGHDHLVPYESVWGLARGLVRILETTQQGTLVQQHPNPINDQSTTLGIAVFHCLLAAISAFPSKVLHELTEVEGDCLSFLVTFPLERALVFRYFEGAAEGNSGGTSSSTAHAGPEELVLKRLSEKRLEELQDLSISVLFGALRCISLDFTTLKKFLEGSGRKGRIVQLLEALQEPLALRLSLSAGEEVTEAQEISRQEKKYTLFFGYQLHWIAEVSHLLNATAIMNPLLEGSFAAAGGFAKFKDCIVEMNRKKCLFLPPHHHESNEWTAKQLKLLLYSAVELMSVGNKQRFSVTLPKPQGLWAAEWLQQVYSSSLNSHGGPFWWSVPDWRSEYHSTDLLSPTSKPGFELLTDIVFNVLFDATTSTPKVGAWNEYKERLVGFYLTIVHALGTQYFQIFPKDERVYSILELVPLVYEATSAVTREGNEQQSHQLLSENKQSRLVRLLKVVTSLLQLGFLCLKDDDKSNRRKRLTGRLIKLLCDYLFFHPSDQVPPAGKSFVLASIVDLLGPSSWEVLEQMESRAPPKKVEDRVKQWKIPEKGKRFLVYVHEIRNLFLQFGIRADATDKDDREPLLILQLCGILGESAKKDEEFTEALLELKHSALQALRLLLNSSSLENVQSVIWTPTMASTLTQHVQSSSLNFFQWKRSNFPTRSAVWTQTSLAKRSLKLVAGMLKELLPEPAVRQAVAIAKNLSRNFSAPQALNPGSFFIPSNSTSDAVATSFGATPPLAQLYYPSAPVSSSALCWQLQMLLILFERHPGLDVSLEAEQLPLAELMVAEGKPTNRHRSGHSPRRPPPQAKEHTSFLQTLLAMLSQLIPVLSDFYPEDGATTSQVPEGLFSPFSYAQANSIQSQRIAIDAAFTWIIRELLLTVQNTEGSSQSVQLESLIRSWLPSDFDGFRFAVESAAAEAGVPTEETSKVLTKFFHLLEGDGALHATGLILSCIATLHAASPANFSSSFLSQLESTLSAGPFGQSRAYTALTIHFLRCLAEGHTKYLVCPRKQASTPDDAGSPARTLLRVGEEMEGSSSNLPTARSRRSSVPPLFRSRETVAVDEWRAVFATIPMLPCSLEERFNLQGSDTDDGTDDASWVANGEGFLQDWFVSRFGASEDPARIIFPGAAGVLMRLLRSRLQTVVSLTPPSERKISQLLNLIQQTGALLLKNNGVESLCWIEEESNFPRFVGDICSTLAAANRIHALSVHRMMSWTLKYFGSKYTEPGFVISLINSCIGSLDVFQHDRVVQAARLLQLVIDECAADTPSVFLESRFGSPLWLRDRQRPAIPHPPSQIMGGLALGTKLHVFDTKPTERSSSLAVAVWLRVPLPSMYYTSDRFGHESPTPPSSPLDSPTLGPVGFPPEKYPTRERHGSLPPGAGATNTAALPAAAAPQEPLTMKWRGIFTLHFSEMNDSVPFDISLLINHEGQFVVDLRTPNGSGELAVFEDLGRVTPGQWALITLSIVDFHQLGDTARFRLSVCRQGRIGSISDQKRQFREFCFSIKGASKSGRAATIISSVELLSLVEVRVKAAAVPAHRNPFLQLVKEMFQKKSNGRQKKGKGASVSKQRLAREPSVDSDLDGQSSVQSLGQAAFHETEFIQLGLFQILRNDLTTLDELLLHAMGPEGMSKEQFLKQSILLNLWPQAIKAARSLPEQQLWVDISQMMTMWSERLRRSSNVRVHYSTFPSTLPRNVVLLSVVPINKDELVISAPEVEEKDPNISDEWVESFAQLSSLDMDREKDGFTRMKQVLFLCPFALPSDALRVRPFRQFQIENPSLRCPTLARNVPHWFTSKTYSLQTLRHCLPALGGLNYFLWLATQLERSSDAHFELIRLIGCFARNGILLKGDMEQEERTALCAVLRHRFSKDNVHLMASILADACGKEFVERFDILQILVDFSLWTYSARAMVEVLKYLSSLIDRRGTSTNNYWRLNFSLLSQVDTLGRLLNHTHLHFAQSEDAIRSDWSDEVADKMKVLFSLLCTEPAAVRRILLSCRAMARTATSTVQRKLMSTILEATLAAIQMANGEAHGLSPLTLSVDEREQFLDDCLTIILYSNEPQLRIHVLNLMQLTLSYGDYNGLQIALKIFRVYNQRNEQLLSSKPDSDEAVVTLAELQTIATVPLIRTPEAGDGFVLDLRPAQGRPQSIDVLRSAFQNLALLTSVISQPYQQIQVIRLIRHCYDLATTMRPAIAEKGPDTQALYPFIVLLLKKELGRLLQPPPSGLGCRNSQSMASTMELGDDLEPPMTARTEANDQGEQQLNTTRSRVELMEPDLLTALMALQSTIFSYFLSDHHINVQPISDTVGMLLTNVPTSDTVQPPPAAYVTKVKEVAIEFTTYATAHFDILYQVKDIPLAATRAQQFIDQFLPLARMVCARCLIDRTTQIGRSHTSSLCKNYLRNSLNKFHVALKLHRYGYKDYFPTDPRLNHLKKFNTRLLPMYIVQVINKAIVFDSGKTSVEKLIQFERSLLTRLLKTADEDRFRNRCAIIHLIKASPKQFQNEDAKEPTCQALLMPPCVDVNCPEQCPLIQRYVTNLAHFDFLVLLLWWGVEAFLKAIRSDEPEVRGEGALCLDLLRILLLTKGSVLRTKEVLHSTKMDALAHFVGTFDGIASFRRDNTTLNFLLTLGSAEDFKRSPQILFHQNAMEALSRIIGEEDNYKLIRKPFGNEETLKTVEKQIAETRLPRETDNREIELLNLLSQLEVSQRNTVHEGIRCLSAIASRRLSLHTSWGPSAALYGLRSYHLNRWEIDPAFNVEGVRGKLRRYLYNDAYPTAEVLSPLFVRPVATERSFSDSSDVDLMLDFGITAAKRTPRPSRPYLREMSCTLILLADTLPARLRISQNALWVESLKTTPSLGVGFLPPQLRDAESAPSPLPFTPPNPGSLTIPQQHPSPCDSNTASTPGSPCDPDPVVTPHHEPKRGPLYVNQFDRPKHEIIVSFSDIRALWERRHVLQNVALEIVLHSGESHLIAFPTVADRDQILFMLRKSCDAHLDPLLFRGKQSSLGLWQEAWQVGRISNLKYIMYCNFMSSRSYATLREYPVVPHVLANYSTLASPLAELNDVTCPLFRDLTKPMGCQTSSREETAAMKYEQLEEMGNVPFHHGSLYSQLLGVCELLLRLPPFSNVYKQGNKEEYLDRLFLSLAEQWKKQNASNGKPTEFVPEMFVNVGVYYNLNQFICGLPNPNRADAVEDRTEVSEGASTPAQLPAPPQPTVLQDVELPPWAKTEGVQFFIDRHREVLESPEISQRLHHWLDLIFFRKQRGPDAVQARNVFTAVSYESDAKTGQQQKVLDAVEAEAQRAQIQEFGCIPSQISTAKHPERGQSTTSSELYVLNPCVSLMFRPSLARRSIFTAIANGFNLEKELSSELAKLNGISLTEKVTIQYFHPTHRGMIFSKGVVKPAGDFSQKRAIVLRGMAKALYDPSTQESDKKCYFVRFNPNRTTLELVAVKVKPIPPLLMDPKVERLATHSIRGVGQASAWDVCGNNIFVGMTTGVIVSLCTKRREVLQADLDTPATELQRVQHTPVFLSSKEVVSSKRSSEQELHFHQNIHWWGHTAEVTALAYCAEWAVMASTGKDGKLVVWDANRRMVVRVVDLLKTLQTNNIAVAAPPQVTRSRSANASRRNSELGRSGSRPPSVSGGSIVGMGDQPGADDSDGSSSVGETRPTTRSTTAPKKEVILSATGTHVKVNPTSGRIVVVVNVLTSLGEQVEFLLTFSVNGHFEQGKRFLPLDASLLAFPEEGRVHDVLTVGSHIFVARGYVIVVLGIERLENLRDPLSAKMENQELPFVLTSIALNPYGTKFSAVAKTYIAVQRPEVPELALEAKYCEISWSMQAIDDISRHSSRSSTARSSTASSQYF